MPLKVGEKPTFITFRRRKLMQTESKEDLTVGGYVFATHTDAEIARNEIKRIAYIEQKMDMTNMNVITGIYKKALESRTFQTPIGLEFMHSLYDSIVKSGMKREDIAPIPLYTTFKRMDFSSSRIRPDVIDKDSEEYKLRVKYRNSVLISGILGALVIIMLLVMFRGTTPNAINYKAAVTNEYAAWAQELSEKEDALREKEHELEEREAKLLGY